MLLRANSPLLQQQFRSCRCAPSVELHGSAHLVAGHEADTALGSQLAPHAEAGEDRVFPFRSAALRLATSATRNRRPAEQVGVGKWNTSCSR